MTVFAWAPTRRPIDPDTMSKDEFNTSWAEPSLRCLFCDEPFERGQHVWHWQVDSGHRDIRAHASCVKKHAAGILQDIAGCIRHG